MAAHQRTKLLQAASCVLCAAVNWRYKSDLWGTEFSGGSVTGRLLDLKLVGDLLLLLAIPLTFVLRRTAAVVTLMACLLCMPLYFYFTAPGPFRRLVGGEWKSPLWANWNWDWWTIAGVTTVLFAVLACVRSLVVRQARV
jgi:hypothetical protein